MCGDVGGGSGGDVCGDGSGDECGDGDVDGGGDDDGDTERSRVDPRDTERLVMCFVDDLHCSTCMYNKVTSDC